MMTKQNEFNKISFLNDLQRSIQLIPQAEEIGQSFANNGTKRVYLVGCGAPNYMFRVITYWANQITNDIVIKNLYPSELLAIKDSLSENTTVIFGSHSGKTTETVDAAEKLKSTNIPTLAITQSTDSALVKQVDSVLNYGTTKQGYFSSYILSQVLVSAFLQKKSTNWNMHETLKESLKNLPAALADAKQISVDKGNANAAFLQNEKSLYVVGNGPMYTTAYVFAACFLLEMQRINAHPINTLDFFHGPFEILDESTPIILLLGEGETRAESERVRDFCDRYTNGCITYDSLDFDMPGIYPDIRPIVAPFIIDAAMTNLVDQLAILRDHPLDTRRYMGKVEY